MKKFLNCGMTSGVFLAILGFLFPISIFASTYATTLQVIPTKDSYVSQHEPNDNYGSDDSLFVKSKAKDSDSDDLNKNKRTLITFDLPTLPAGAVIQSAVLKFYMIEGPTGARTYYIKRNIADWQENVVNWNNTPNKFSIVTASTSISNLDNQNVSWDVKSDVLAFYAGTYKNYGWTIYDNSEGSTDSKNNYEAEFSSKENSNVSERPILEITYTLPNLPPTLAHISDQTVDEMTNLSFNGTATDSENDPLTFSIANAPEGSTFSTTTPGQFNFSWTPTEAQGPGVYSPTISVSDGVNQLVSQTFKITVNEVNTPPTAFDQNSSTDQNTDLPIDLVTIDSDIPAQTLTFSTVTPPTNGTLGPIVDSKVTYTPNHDFSGTDSFTFKANDGLLDSNTATVNIKVNSQCTAQPPQIIVSDEETLKDDGSPSVAVSNRNSRWTASIPGATWIWGEDPVTDVGSNKTETFTRAFDIAGNPAGASLDIAADNTYVFSVNGKQIGQNQSEFNYESSPAEDGTSGQGSYQIPAEDLLSGPNLITFNVTNLGDENSNSENDPGGLLYKLTVDSNQCEIPPPLEPRAKLVATAIVCDNESYLPNWGAEGGHPIDSNTATDFLSANPNCHLDTTGWYFQWTPSYDGISDPGSNLLTPVGSPWTTFGPTDDTGTASTTIPSGNGLWLWGREILKVGYVPFSNWLNPDNGNKPSDQDKVSAEMYCSNDGNDYNNYDWINPVDPDSTEYCVGFNATSTAEKDTTAPVSVFISPKSGDTLEDKSVTISGNTTDDVMAASTTLSFAPYTADGDVCGDYTNITSLINIDQKNPFEWSYDWIPGYGYYCIAAQSQDTSGNVEEISVVKNITYKEATEISTTTDDTAFTTDNQTTDQNTSNTGGGNGPVVGSFGGGNNATTGGGVSATSANTQTLGTGAGSFSGEESQSLATPTPTPTSNGNVAVETVANVNGAGNQNPNGTVGSTTVAQEASALASNGLNQTASAISGSSWLSWKSMTEWALVVLVLLGLALFIFRHKKSEI